MLNKSHNQVHMHGARVPWTSDGFPESVFHPGEGRIFHYPNNQPAATLWYHDHAMDVTRLNVYAGLFGETSFGTRVKDAIGHAASLDEDLWAQMVGRWEKRDVLHAGELNPLPAVDLSSLHSVLSIARVAWISSRSS